LKIRRQPLTKLDLPDEIQAILKKKKLFTVGDALLTWGFHPGYLGLNDDGREELHKALAAIPNMEEVWLEDAPWRIWDPGHTWNGLIWVLILAVIGARIYHILTPSPSMAAIGIESPLDYLRNPLAMIDLRQGGLGIYGGMAGGLLGLLIYTRRARIPLWGWADLGVVGVALGQAIGRWGNFINQELYGRPTDLPWAVSIEPAHRLPEFAEFSSFHPAFLYESLWNLLAFFVLYTLAHRYRQRLFTGDLTAIYLIFYGTGRILLELVRLDSRTVVIGNLDLGLPIATLVSLVVALLAAGWLIWRHYSARRTPQSNASG
jgi:phosphatidylglycerol:prolipoprotein diacylglycerol transferase